MIEVHASMEDVAEFLVFGKPWQRAVSVFIRILPLVISASVAIYSALSSSIFDDMQFVAVTAFNFLLYASMLFMGLVGIAFASNLYDSSKVRVKRQEVYRDPKTDIPVIVHLFENIRNSIWKALQLTLQQIANTMFVILLPAGAIDIISGVAYNNLNIGISGTSYIDYGIVITVFSVLFLIYHIYSESTRLKRLTKRKARELRAKIERHENNYDKDPRNVEEYVMRLDDDL